MAQIHSGVSCKIMPCVYCYKKKLYIYIADVGRKVFSVGSPRFFFFLILSSLNNILKYLLLMCFLYLIKITLRWLFEYYKIGPRLKKGWETVC